MAPDSAPQLLIHPSAAGPSALGPVVPVPSGRPTPGSKPVTRHPEPSRPLQLAQLVWHRALDLTAPDVEHDALAVVLELLQTAHHDIATMSHALTLGRAQVHEHPSELAARRGTKLLERAIAFMGAEPRAGSR